MRAVLSAGTELAPIQVMAIGRGHLPRRLVLGIALLFPACAGTRPAPETASAPRLKDSAPEKVAAQQAATPELEAEDARWGITAAKERKRVSDEQRKDAAAKEDVRPNPTFELTPIPPPN